MPRLLLSACLCGTVLLSCSGGRNDATFPGAGGDFFVLATDPPAGAQVYLNDSIAVTFTNDVDLGTANLNTVSFAVFDLNGQALQEQPRGTFAVGAAFGDADGSQRVLLFQPAFPDDDDFSNGGFKPGRRYLLQLATGDPHLDATLKDTGGKGLSKPFTLAFQTVDGATPSQLFRDTAGGGPRIVGAEVTPALDGIAPLGKKGERPVEVRVAFDQPLNPASTNVPRLLDPNPAVVDPRTISATAKGRIFLEYDDPEYGAAAWIPAFVALERNDNRGSTVLLTPGGVLPNGASVRLIVESTLEDLSGESNRNSADHQRAVFTFPTEAARAPQFDAIIEDFDTLEQLDLAPTFLEPLAEIGAGYVRAGLAFAGTETEFDYRPNATEVVLNTDFTQIAPTNGAPFSVSGGVFHFRDVTIPAGVTVRGTGTKPMVWLVTGDFVVEGVLSVEGGTGARVDTLRSANFPTPGGIGTCGGGNGGRGSPSASDTDDRGEHGFGAFQAVAGGGRGGTHACKVTSPCGRGGGGGGGSFATQGDPHYCMAWLASPPGLPLVGNGQGGRMCLTPRANSQASAGPLGFKDSRPDNDFWGGLVDLARGARVSGELLAPRGGAGGGGGGDANDAPDPVRCAPNQTFVTDRKGGGGGAGGGVLVVQALGPIVVKASGRITASGGHGGGGEEAGGNEFGGGGGGGSGGMVVLMSASGVHLVKHGAAYAQGTLTGTGGAYEFAIEADGGVGLRGTFPNQTVRVAGKYPGRGGPASNATWDVNAIGGFGGLGVVQLMTPPGANRPVEEDGDGTNTVLDDRVFFYDDDSRLAQGLASDNPHVRNGPAITGALKETLLGWRGFRRANGTPGRNDANGDVRLEAEDHGEGDIRPSPILLPAPFGATSRVRSRWIDTGATARLVDATGTQPAPRTMVEHVDASDPTNPITSLRAGPTYLFSGTFSGGGEPQGYVRYGQTELGVEREIAAVLATPAAVQAVVAGAEWRGQPAYLVTLRDRSAVLGQTPGRYTGYRAQLQSALGTALGSFRILGHTGREIYLSTDAGTLPEEPTATVQVLAELFGYRTTDADDMGATFVERGARGARNVPRINARIGFAFHVNPSAARFPVDDDRIPREANEFLHELDLLRPDVMRRIRALGKTSNGTRGAVAVQYDILFNMAFSEASAGHVVRQPDLAPGAPRPELHFLALPFQF